MTDLVGQRQSEGVVHSLQQRCQCVLVRQEGLYPHF